MGKRVNDFCDVQVCALLGTMNTIPGFGPVKENNDDFCRVTPLLGKVFLLRKLNKNVHNLDFLSNDFLE